MNIHLCSLSFFKITAIIIGTNVLIIKFKDTFNTKFLTHRIKILRLAAVRKVCIIYISRLYLPQKPNNRFSLQRENTNTAKMQNVKPTNVPATGILCIDNLYIIQILQLSNCYQVGYNQNSSFYRFLNRFCPFCHTSTKINEEEIV